MTVYKLAETRYVPERHVRVRCTEKTFLREQMQILTAQGYAVH